MCLTMPLTDLTPTRETLLIRLRNTDDNESWRDFFNTYWKLIFEVALKAGLTETEAEEVVQETVISVSRKMPTFDYDPAQGSFKGWLLNLTRWRIADQLRKRRPLENIPIPCPDGEGNRRTATIERVADPASSNLEDIWDEEWRKNLMDAALEKVKRQVKSKQYQIFDMYVLQRWPVKKVMQTLGVNLGQVYLAKHRIGRLLRQELKGLEEQMQTASRVNRPAEHTGTKT